MLARFEYNEPMDHDSDAIRSSMIPITSIFVLEFDPWKTNTMIPANPKNNPTNSNKLGFFLSPLIQFKPLIHNGTDAIIKLAMDDGTRISAYATSPLPPNRRSAPTKPALNISFLVGNVSFLINAKVDRMIPAVVCRIPAMIKGGKDTRANFIPR